MNKVILIGRLTADPELRYTPNGKAVCTVCVAVDREYKQEGGQEADFPWVEVWGTAAENLAKYMTKGGRIGIDGRLALDQYEKDGQKRTGCKVIANRVEFLGNVAQKQQAPQSSAQPQQSQAYSSAGTPMGQEISFSDGDLPF